MTSEMTVYSPQQDGLSLAQLGQAIVKSGYFQDARDASQAIVKVLAGRELGLGPIAAMTGIYLVKGRVTMSANLIAAQIKRSGRYSYQVVEMGAESVEIAFQELRGGAWVEIGRSSFTKADAQAAGLWGSSDPWKKTPRNMLFARAMSNGAKWYCPDVFVGPVYTPDELSDIEAPAPAPAAYVVNTQTGEISEAESTARESDTEADQRQALIAELRGLVTQAKALGLDPGVKGLPREMTTAQLQEAIAGVRGVIDAEYAAVEAEAVA